MTDISDHCQKLLVEYRVLRRQLEEDAYINPDIGDEDDGADLKADRERLEELQEILEEECDVDVMTDDDDDESELDLPEYAAKSPSEPMDFDQE